MTSQKTKQQNKPQERRTCRMCEHHYDEHDRGYNGQMILCRCPFHKWCRLLDYEPDTCDNFKKIKIKMKKALITILLLAISAIAAAAGEDWHDVTATVYNPTAAQCDSTPLVTASNKVIDLELLKAGKLRWIAVSRDLLQTFPYGTSVYIWITQGHPFNGSYIVRDTMHSRYTNCIDILTYNTTTGKWTAKIQKNP